MIRSTYPLFRCLPLALLLIYFLWTSFYGLNFGWQWDENRAKFDAVRDTLQTGLFLQDSTSNPSGPHYNHGGLNYLITWSGFAPEILRYLINGPRTRDGLYQAITPVLYDSKVRVRRIYVILSSLAIVWVFAIDRRIGRSRLEAFLAAAILSLSWEFGYHSRWVAGDVVMTQFVWLALLCVVAAVETSEKTRWLYIGAASIGLAMGAKYTGVLVLPFFLAGAARTFWLKQYSIVYAFRHCAGLVATALFIFLLTTPGAVLDPFRFANQLQEQREIYSSGWYGYTVTPGLAHFLGILKYFLLEGFAHFWWVSVVLAGFSAAGVAALMLERKWLPLLALAFCLTYLAFFSRHEVMIVRNVLPVLPFLAIAAARGITITAESLRGRLKPAVYAAAGLLLSVNLGWNLYAARQIKLRHHFDVFLMSFAAYVRDSPGDRFLVSQKLLGALRTAAPPIAPNVVTDPAASYTKVAFLQSEGPDKLWERWPSNAWGLYEKIFGPLEVNLEAYTTFLGNERILVVTREKFETLPLSVRDLTDFQ